MSAPTIPSFFRDVSNVTLTPTLGGTAINVFACKGIKWSRKRQNVLGYDNNTTRPVAYHTIGESDDVSIMTEDMNAIISLYGTSGTFTLNFNWLPDSQQGSSALGEQTVQMTNFFLNETGADAAMRAQSTGSISGGLLGVEANTDPVTINSGS